MDSSQASSQVVKYIYSGQDIADIPKDITHLEIDPSVEEIPASAFDECSSLVEVHCNEGLRTIGKFAFQRCTALRTLSISSTVVRIEAKAFAWCESLSEVKLQEGLLFIGERAFFLCKDLRSILLPSTVSMIGEHAFDSCINLVEITFQESYYNRSQGENPMPTSSLTLGDGIFLYCTSLKHVRLPEGLGSIPKEAFASCEELRHFNVPTTVERIGECAFDGCASLYEIRFHEGLVSIEECAFMECSALRIVSFPTSLIRIGDAAFSGCESLVDVEFAEGLEYIGEEAFLECESLGAISLPRSVVRIEEDAFICCTSLLGVEFPNGINPEIPASCFFECSSLVNVSIPSSMQRSVDDEAFSGCGLLQVHNGQSNNSWFPNAIRNRFAQLPVHATCYNASIATVDELLVALDSSANPEGLTDAFGMTPFHIIATSAMLRPDFMEILLARYPVGILACKDNHKKTMMDYLLMHKSTKAIPLIKVVLRHFLDAYTSGLVSDTQRLDLYMLVDSICGEGHSKTRRDSFIEVSKSFTSCMQLEITSIVEMGLWKLKIAQMEKEEPTGKVDRAFCRYKCGADIVVHNVVRFAWEDPAASCFAGLLPIGSSDFENMGY